MQFTAMFYGCENGNVQVIKCYIYLIFAQNIDFGYTLVRRFSRVPTIFVLEQKKRKIMYTPLNPKFTI